MELLFGIGGILALSLFAVVFGFDIMALIDEHRKARREKSETIDPNSTLSVTLEVMKDQTGPNIQV